jgi:hypothetical protein
MFNSISSIWLLGWLAAVGVVVASSVLMDAYLSTSALLLAIGLAPLVVIMFMRAGAPSPTVTEVLHSATRTDGRS